MPDEINTKPCPFSDCQSARTAVEHGGEGDCHSYKVRCMACEATGPIASTPEYAAGLWNNAWR